ncbi:gastrin/cholecystokinin type B receptor [Drosophila sulfurigaster albostrigata]|uniref:gastrin/cholecystokinin type B receptor n=1 Tax=Drosophila sulfurigaster albostrigata TaxID=89887 RepID=UPI002D219BBD|nr:gastrin/cholecystokinin type B receptor [Drosophila sulfurigaster albostrigata]
MGMFSLSSEDADASTTSTSTATSTSTSTADGAAYKALLDYYANAQSAASHIVSLTLSPLNDTLAGMAVNATGGGASNCSVRCNDSFNDVNDVDDSALAASNFYVITESSLDTESPASATATGAGAGAGAGGGAGSGGSATEMPVWLIPSYSVILLFAVLGNLLVISTLMQNRRMRTITNLFLLNLAISDMLLGVLCMPVTLVGTLLRNFIFGEFLCKLIQFSQAASVAVSSWTLVAISCERYYAICHPLRSRSWQTISHAYKIIGFIWLGGILCMTPIAVFSQLIPTSRPGYCKCREHWPDQGYERFYNIMLDLILLVLPLLVLCVAYILITRTLYVGMHVGGKDVNARTTPLSSCNPQPAAAAAAIAATPGSSSCILVLNAPAEYNESSNNNNSGTTTTTTATATATTTLTTTATATTTTLTTVTLAKTSASSPSLRVHDAALRRSNEAKTLESKKRVVKMLFVLVLEFFICWTPLYVINTLSMFIGQALYEYIDYTSISYLQLLAYSSSCCNPITYCFMNASFRRAFVDTFKGLPWHRSRGGLSASQAGIPNVANNNPGLAMDTWRSRSRHEQLLNSVVYTNSAAAADSPQL